MKDATQTPANPARPAALNRRLDEYGAVTLRLRRRAGVADVDELAAMMAERQALLEHIKRDAQSLDAAPPATTGDHTARTIAGRLASIVDLDAQVVPILQRRTNALQRESEKLRTHAKMIYDW